MVSNVSAYQNDTTSSNNSIGGTQADDEVCELCVSFNINDYAIIPQMAMAVFMLTFNLLTITATYRCYSMTPTVRMTLLNLSVIDVTSSLVFGYHVMMSWNVKRVTAECLVRYIMFVSLITVTQCTMTFISTDRFLSVVRVYEYQSLNTDTYTKVSVSAVWISAAVCVIIGFARPRSDPEACYYPLLVTWETHLFFGSFSITNLIYIVSTNVYLFIYARRQMKKIAPTLVGMTSEARDQEMAKMSLKSIRTTISVVVPFVLLNTPLYAFFLFLTVDDDYGKTVEGLFVMNYLSSAVILNSFVNPFVYVWRLPEVRVQVKKLLRSLKPSKCNKR